MKFDKLAKQIVENYGSEFNRYAERTAGESAGNFAVVLHINGDFKKVVKTFPSRHAASKYADVCNRNSKIAGAYYSVRNN